MLCFAQTREHAGCSSTTLEVPAGSRVRDALEALLVRHPSLMPLRAHLALSLNGVLVRGDAAVVEGAELALLPPVSGG